MNKLKTSFTFKKTIKKMQRFSNRYWYGPLLTLLAVLDCLIVVIPIDGILISSSMILKRRWFLYACAVTIGSTLGALIVYTVAQDFGIQKILEIYPAIDQTNIWSWTQGFFQNYGVLVIFFVGLFPITQQPALIMAAIGEVSFIPLVLAIFVSRIIKFSIMAFIASHAPRMLNKLWGVRKELKDSGVNIN